MDIKRIEKIEVAVLEKENEGVKVIVYNDDVNSFDHVIDCFMAYCEHTMEQATQCAYIIHNNGKCEVKRGEEEKLKSICTALTDSDLSAKIE